METLHHDKIVINERIRKEYKGEGLYELADSIERIGLLHAPVINSKTRELVVGGRRLKAMITMHSLNVKFKYCGEDVPEGEIPIVYSDFDNVEDALEAEIDENVRRVQLTWQEEANAYTKLHELRSKEAEAADKRQSYLATAEELIEMKGGGSLMATGTKVRNSVILSEYMDDPDVQKAKTQKEALKIVKKKRDNDHRIELSKTFDLAKIEDKHTVLQGAMQDLITTVEENTVDLIIADPPYGIDADTFRNQSAVKHAYKDDKDYADSIMNIIATEGMRITKKDAHAYVFCDINRFPEVKKIFEDAGWYAFSTPLIWNKGHRYGLLPLPDKGPRRCYEAIAYFIKGDKKVNYVAPDVLNIPHDTEVTRGAHKPPKLYEELMRRSMLPGQLVLDPTCGSGPVFPAAHKAEVRSIGFEIEDGGYAYCVERIRRIVEGEDDVSVTEDTEAVDENNSLEDF